MNLPIRDTIFETFQFIWDERIDLLRMIAAPVFALSLFQVILKLTVGDTAEVVEEQGQVPGHHLLILVTDFLLSVVFYVMFAVAWHRRCLRSEEQTTILTALRWDRRKTLFLLRFLLISILAAVSALPIMVIGSILGLFTALGMGAGGVGGPGTGSMMQFVAVMVIFLVVMLVQVRLSLILPATALDQKLTLVEVWALGRGNSWRMFSILIMSMAPAMVVFILVATLIAAAAHGTGLGDTLTFQFISHLIYNLAHYVVIAISVSALSITYRKLRQTPSPGMPYYM